MPTTRRRHQITETDEIARAIDDAAKRWPTESRAGLLARLVELGHAAVLADTAGERDARRAAILATSGALAGAYGPNYLAELRADWPA